VRGLRNRWAAIVRLVAPSATNRAICSSCGVSWLAVLGSRLRAVSPVARNSVWASSAQGAVPSCSNVSCAARRYLRASARQRRRRNTSPYNNSVRAVSKGRPPWACRRRASPK